MALARREHAEELLDAPRHDMAELEQSLGHVASVNRWLGGVRAITMHLKPLLERGSAARILDVATGSADIPYEIGRWAQHHHLNVEIVATDVHPQMLELARKRCAEMSNITVEPADALRLPYPDRSFDVAMLSLALHHFEADDQIRVLREMARVAREMVIVNDLERTHANYAGAWLLSMTYWRGNRLTRHDGPLSVLRSFTRNELQRITDRAGIPGRLHRHFFQRIVFVGDVTAMAAAARTELR